MSCLLTCLLVVVSEAQQNSVRIEFAGDSSRTTLIGAFRRGGTVYASLTDLAHMLSLTVYENTESRKLEVKHPPLRLKVAGGNPFVVITDSSENQSIYQLPQDVLFAANAFFVPLTSFLPLFRPAFGVSAAFNAHTATLGLGRVDNALAIDIPIVRLEPKANGMLIRIAAQKNLSEYEHWLRADGWLYVTIGDARANVGAINAVKPQGLVKEILAIQSPTSVQLTFRLSGNIATTEIVPDEASHDLLLLVRKQSAEETAPPPKQQAKEQGTPARELRQPVAESPADTSSEREHETPPELDGERNRWKLDVIVLDAGHGGYDPGTIGVTGVKEKTVSLGIVLKLGALISKHMKGMRVVYTRKDDHFVELDRRGKIANEAGGKLFISVHCNALPRKPSRTRGFEVYLLRPGRTEDAIAIAERENSVIKMEPGYEERYPKLTDENFILTTMAQSAHVRASEMFADLAQQEMRSHTGIPNRGVKQAGFYVLVGAAMPNVLVETAYLSNREDERLLRSDAGQQRVAESLFRAIKKYKDEYEKLLSEGKEIGEAN